MCCYARIAIATFVVVCAVHLPAEELAREFARIDQIGIVDVDLVLSKYQRYRAELAAIEQALKTNNYHRPEPGFYCDPPTETLEIRDKLSPSHQARIDTLLTRNREKFLEHQRLLERRSVAEKDALLEIRKQIAEFCQEHGLLLVLQRHDQDAARDGHDCSLPRLDETTNDDLFAVYHSNCDISHDIIERLNAKSKPEGE